MNGEVKSADIGQQHVRSPDLLNNGVRGIDIQDGGVTGADVASSSLSGNHVAGNSLTGGEINEGTLDPFGTLGFFTEGRSARAGSCNPTSTTYVDCTGVTFTIERTSRVLVNGRASLENTVTGAGFSVDDPTVAGRCRLEVNDAISSMPHSTDVLAEWHATGEDHVFRSDGISTMAVTNPLSAGTHRFEISCNETTADAGYRDVQISAVAIGQS